MFMNKKGSSLLETRRLNRVSIKDTIYKMEPVTRTDIAREIGLTLPTITTSVNEMLEEGLLEEVPLPENRLVSSVGRKPAAVRFKPEAALAVGIELGPYATRAVLMNMNGDVLRSSEEVSGDENYQIMVEKLARQIRSLVGESHSLNLLGVGIGLPGFIDCDKGIVRSNPRKDWTGRKLTDDLEKLIRMPVKIDNNVRLRAIGYTMSCRGYKPDTFAYFYISKGVACPLIVKDEVLSGHTSGAGEIGHTMICVDSQGVSRQRSLDELVGEKTILKRCQMKMEQGGAEILSEIVRREGELGMKQVLEAQLQKDEDVCSILQEIIEYLGIALANVVNLINPGFVVVDGYIMKNDVNQRLLRQAAGSKFYGLNEEEVSLVFRHFHHFYGAKGAAYFIIRRLFLEK